MPPTSLLVDAVATTRARPAGAARAGSARAPSCTLPLSARALPFARSQEMGGGGRGESQDFWEGEKNKKIVTFVFLGIFFQNNRHFIGPQDSFPNTYK